MVNFGDIYQSLLPYLTVQESRTLGIALPVISRSYRTGSVGLFHTWSCLPLLPSEKWHQAIQGLLGKNEYTLLMNACKGGPDPYVIVDSPSETVENVFVTALSRLNTTLSNNNETSASSSTSTSSSSSSSSSSASLQGLLLNAYHVLSSSSKEGLPLYRSNSPDYSSINLKTVLSLPLCSIIDWMETWKLCNLGADDTATGMAAFLLILYKLSRPLVCYIQSTGNLLTALQARQEVYIENIPPALIMHPIRQSFLHEDTAWMYTNTSSSSPSSNTSSDEQQHLQYRKHLHSLYESIAKQHYESSPLLTSLHASPAILAPPSVTVIRARGSTSFSSPADLTVGALLFAFDILLYRCQPKLHDYIRTSNASITDIIYRWLVQGYATSIPFRQPGSSARWVTSVLLSGGWIEWLRIGIGIFTLISTDLLTLPPYSKEIRSYLQTFPRRGLLEIKKLHTAIQQSGATPEKTVAALALACSYHPRDLGSAGSFDTAGILYRSAVISVTPSSSNPSYDPTGHTLSQLVGQYRGAFGMKFKPLVGSLLIDNNKAPLMPFVCNPSLLPSLPDIGRTISNADAVSEAVLRFARFGMMNRNTTNTTISTVPVRSRGNSRDNRSHSTTKDDTTPTGKTTTLASVGEENVPGNGIDESTTTNPYSIKDTSPSSNRTLIAIAKTYEHQGAQTKDRSASASPVPHMLDNGTTTTKNGNKVAYTNNSTIQSQGPTSRRKTTVDLPTLFPHRNEIPHIPSSIPGVMVPDPEALVRIIANKADAHGVLHDKATHHWHQIAEVVHRGSVQSAEHRNSSDSTDRNKKPLTHTTVKNWVSPPPHTSETYYVDAWKDVVDTSVRRRRSSLQQVSGKEIAEIDANVALNAIVNDSLRVLRMCRIDLSSPNTNKPKATNTPGNTNGSSKKGFLTLVESAMEAKLFGDMVTSNDNDPNDTKLSSNEKRKISPGNKTNPNDTISEAAKERMRNLLLPRGYSVEHSSLTGSLTLEQIMNPLEHNIPTVARQIAAAAISSGVSVSPTKVVYDLLSRVRDAQDPMEQLLEKTKTVAEEPGAVIQAAISTGTDKLHLPTNIFEVIDQSNRPAPVSPVVAPVEHSLAYLSVSTAPLDNSTNHVSSNAQKRFITQSVSDINHVNGSNDDDNNKSSSSSSILRPQRQPPTTPGASVVQMKLGTVFSTLSPTRNGTDGTTVNSDNDNGNNNTNMNRVPVVPDIDKDHHILNAGLNTLPPTTAFVPPLESTYPIAAALVKDMNENAYYPAPPVTQMDIGSTSTKERIISVFDDAIKSEYPYLSNPAVSTTMVERTVPVSTVTTASLDVMNIPTSPVPKRIPPPRPIPGYGSTTKRSISPMKVLGTTVESAAGMYVTGYHETTINNGRNSSNSSSNDKKSSVSVPRYLSKDFSTSHILIGKPLQNILNTENSRTTNNTDYNGGDDDKHAKNNNQRMVEADLSVSTVTDDRTKPFYTHDAEEKTTDANVSTPAKANDTKKYDTSFLSSLSASLIENETRSELSLLASALLESATKTAQTPRSVISSSSHHSLPLTSPLFAVAANDDFTSFKVNQSSLPDFTLDQRFRGSDQPNETVSLPSTADTQPTTLISVVPSGGSIHPTPRPVLHVSYEAIHSPLNLDTSTTTTTTVVTEMQNISFDNVTLLRDTEESVGTEGLILYPSSTVPNDTNASPETTNDSPDNNTKLVPILSTSTSTVSSTTGKIRQTTLLLKQRSTEIKSALSSTTGSLTPRNESRNDSLTHTPSLQSSGNSTPRLYLGRTESNQSIDDLTSVASVRSYADEAMKKLQTISSEFLENNEM